MRKRLLVSVLIFLFGFSPVLSGIQSNELDICDNFHEWLATPLPPHLIGFLCTIVDDGSPIRVIEDPGSLLAASYEPAIEDSEFPEDVKQQLLLFLALWSQR